MPWQEKVIGLQPGSGEDGDDGVRASDVSGRPELAQRGHYLGAGGFDEETGAGEFTHRGL
jgi:hypothetical protein